MGQQLLADHGAGREPHIEHQGLLVSCQQGPVEIPGAPLAVGGDEAHALGVIAVGQGNAGVGGAAAGRGDPRHHLKADAAAHQRLQLLAATAEDEGVAPLQPHHPLPLLRLLQQELVDPLLGHAVVARLLADEDALGVAAHQRHHLVGDQPVIDHHVRLLHLAQGVQGEQTRIAGAGTDQHDFAVSLALLGKQAVGQLIGRGAIPPRQRLTEPVRPEQPLPEAAPLSHGGEARLDPLPQATGEGRHGAQMLRQQGFEFFPQQAGQHRGLAAGGDGHHQRRAVDDGRHDEAGACRVVHHIGKDPRLIRALVDQGVHLAPIGGGHHQPLARQLLRREFTGQPLDAAVGSQFRQLGVELGRDYCELGTGIQQQARLALRYLAAADQQHGFVVESAKDGQVVHGAS
ncbi:hypothetical protein D3C76_847870 [compost metagenome]